MGPNIGAGSPVRGLDRHDTWTRVSQTQLTSENFAPSSIDVCSGASGHACPIELNHGANLFHTTWVESDVADLRGHLKEHLTYNGPIVKYNLYWLWSRFVMPNIVSGCSSRHPDDLRQDPKPLGTKTAPQTWASSVICAQLHVLICFKKIPNTR